MTTYATAWTMNGVDHAFNPVVVNFKINEDDMSLDMFNEDGSEATFFGYYADELDDLIHILKAARHAFEVM